MVVLCVGVALGIGAAFVGFNRSHLWQRDFHPGHLVVAEEGDVANPAHDSSAPLRKMVGMGVQMVFHSYQDYGDGSSQLWYYETVTGATALISGGWQTLYGITDPMNPMFWPGSTDDARWVTFMAVADGEWNVFMVNIDDPGTAPVNLTKAGASTKWERNEDPKFSADGAELYFKRDGDIVVANIEWKDQTPTLGHARALTNTTMNGTQDESYVGDDVGSEHDTTGEESMPFPDPTGRTVFFTRGTHREAGVWALCLVTEVERPVMVTEGVSEYYPIIAADGTLFFVRWTAPDDPHDTIWIQEPNETHPRLLLARQSADVADPAPVTGPDILVFSMTDGDQTPFRLHVLDIRTGEEARIPLDGVPGNMLGTSLRYAAS